MYKFIIKLNNFFYFKITFVFTILVYASLIFVKHYQRFLKLNDGDNFLRLFNRFLEIGFYKSSVEGTSILYNLALYAVNKFTQHIETSFIVLGILTQIFLIVFSYFFMKKIANGTSNLYITSVIVLYLLYLLVTPSYVNTYNDTFMAIFISLLLYMLIYVLPKNMYRLQIYILIGVVYALALSVRPTAILFAPLLIIALFANFYKSKIGGRFMVKYSITLIVALCSVCFILHYPSLKENKKLSFYNKVPSEIKENWIQRNYLGLKKIEQGKLKPNRDAIWVHTKFSKVRAYLKTHGADSLPKNIIEVVQRDPLLVIKLAVYNILFSILRFFRFWGFLIVALIIPFIKKTVKFEFKIIHLPPILFLTFFLIICTVAFTFTEYRWFVGYEILIPLTLIIYEKQHEIVQKLKFKNLWYSMSFIVVALFNIRTIINLL